MAAPHQMTPEPAAPPTDEGKESPAGASVELSVDTAADAAASVDLSMLIRILGETDRRLEELTGPEIDLVTDREGRSYLLRRAQERWRHAAAEQQAIIIDALPASIALLGVDGVILHVNESWRRFARTHALPDEDHGVGLNYLEICDRAQGAQALDSAQAAAGLRSVLAGSVDKFSMEYFCPGTEEDYWFQLTITPVRNHFPMAAVIMHHDITARRRTEEDLHRFSAAMEASLDGIRFIDRAQMRIIHVNEAACRMHQMERDQVLALRPWEVVKMSRSELESIYERLIGGEADVPQTALLSMGNAPPRWIEVRSRALLIGGRWTIFATDRDVTAQKEAESRIVHLNRVHAVLSGINALIVRARDRDELFREACRIVVEAGSLALAWICLLDKSLGRLTLTASAGVAPEYLAAIARRVETDSLDSPRISMAMQVMSDRKPFVSNDSQHDPNVRFRDMHGTQGINAIAVFPLVIADQAVGVMVLCAREPGFFQAEQLKLLADLARDVAFAMTQIEKQARLDYLAYYDVLTGLANRTLFLERVAQYMRGIGAGGGGKLALILIDLERFKNINESLGRTAGDSIMCQMAEWLRRDAGDANLVAHIEADRFALVMPNVADEEEVARHLERTLERLMNHSFTWLDAGYRIAAKAGVVLYPDDGEDADTLLKHAEVAVKRAKSGGDRYLFYALKMTETVMGRLHLENQLRQALELDQYVLHYQPKVDAASGKLVGAEALIRWIHPVNGMIPPGQFVPILEETGLINQVGRWALETALAQYLRWLDAGLGAVRIAVNLSSLQLRNRDFVANIERVLSVDADAAAGLELEITESLIMDDVNLSIANLHVIRALGVRVAIDDFGTGFSSLSYLSKLPVDSVKIDRSFVSDMVLSPGGLSLVSIIINLAHSLKLRVVAEGVETEEQSRLLQLLSCDEMQGYLFSKPLPADLFAQKYLVERAPPARRPAGSP